MIRCLQQCLEQDDVELSEAAIKALVELATDEVAEDDARIKALDVLAEYINSASTSGPRPDFDHTAAAALVPLLDKDFFREKVTEVLQQDGVLKASHVEALITMAINVYGSEDARIRALELIVAATAQEGEVELDDDELAALVPLLREGSLRDKVTELFEIDDVVLSQAAIDALVELAKDDDAEKDARIKAIAILQGAEPVDHLGAGVLERGAGVREDLVVLLDTDGEDEIVDEVRQLLESWIIHEKVCAIDPATLKALIKFASEDHAWSAQSRTIAVVLISDTLPRRAEIGYDVTRLDNLVLSETFLSGAARILANDLFDDSEEDEYGEDGKPDDETIKSARLCVCKLLGAIKPADVDRLMPHVAAIASLHPGPARTGAKEIFRKLVAPDQPARIVRLLGHNEPCVRLLCLIALECFTPGPQLLSADIWTAIGALQIDSNDEVRTIASLMVKNQVQPTGANHMYQRARRRFADAQGPPAFKRAKTLP